MTTDSGQRLAGRRVRVIDSHTGGEPTRVVLDGAPDLGDGDAAARRAAFRERHDGFRSAVVNEPRGYDHLVGALLCEPDDPAAVAQVIFFNNVGYLGMCVHGTIGVAVTLARLGRIEPGAHVLETPVGDVGMRLHPDGRVSVRNVPSYRTARAVEVETREHGRVRGDVAWGGNWFFLVEDHGQRLAANAIHPLTEYCQDVREALAREGITGTDGAEVDHVELFAGPDRDDADSKNFVLCPGREYDRSPCGTGTSAKMACLYADGVLEPGRPWRQESIVGSVFEGRVEPVEEGGRELPDGAVVAVVSGRAWITAEADLVFLEDDPFREGIRT